MVTGEGLILQNDLVTAIDIGAVKGRHQEVNVGSQGLHDSHLGHIGTYDGRNELCSFGIGIQPRRKRGLLKRLEMALHSLSGPCGEILIETGDGSLGLHTQRIAAEIDALGIIALGRRQGG